MGNAESLDVAAVIERQPFNRFAVVLLGISMFTTFVDGFDLMVLAYAAPWLASAYGLDERALGNLLTIGLAGNMLGALASTWVGDRWGRRPALVWSTLAFGVCTLTLAGVQGYGQFLLLRFLQGLALGGALPLLIALNIEYAPRHRRATMVTLVTMGFGLGSALAGPIALRLHAAFDWRASFVFGGLVSLLAFALLLWRLPESLRFLVQARRPVEVIARALHRFAPGQGLPAPAFHLSDEAPAARVQMRSLFLGHLGAVTPLLWLGYCASAVATFLLGTWGPLLFEAIGFTRESAAYMASANWLVGIIGGLALMRLTDRIGIRAVAAMAALAIPVMLALGLVAMAPAVFVAASLWIALTLVGAHYGIISVVGLFYPSAVRARGAGAATTVARIGSLLGPQLGGLLMASQLPPARAFAIIALCPALLCMSILLVVRVQRRASIS